jgi:hypothetical protein
LTAVASPSVGATVTRDHLGCAAVACTRDVAVAAHDPSERACCVTPRACRPSRHAREPSGATNDSAEAAGNVENAAGPCAARHSASNEDGARPAWAGDRTQAASESDPTAGAATERVGTARQVNGAASACACRDAALEDDVSTLAVGADPGRTRHAHRAAVAVCW